MEEVKVVYALIIDKDNRILMVNNHEGHWSLPGGRVEINETLIEATIREVYEETGLHIKVGNVLAVNEAKFLKSNQHAIFFTFEAERIGGTEEIKMPQEILQLEWVNLEQANQRMPYYPDGIHQLMQGNARYTNQGTI